MRKKRKNEILQSVADIERGDCVTFEEVFGEPLNRVSMPLRKVTMKKSMKLSRREYREAVVEPAQRLAERIETPTKKADRFERLVVSITKSDEDVGYDKFCFPDDVASALRKEHRWVERMIKQLEKETTSPGSFYDGYTCALLKVLHLLEKRRK